MDNVFLEMVDETLKNNGIDTTEMTPEEKIAKFEELANKSPEVAEEVVEKVAEEAEAEQEPANEEEQPDGQPIVPTKLC